MNSLAHMISIVEANSPMNAFRKKHFWFLVMAFLAAAAILSVPSWGHAQTPGQSTFNSSDEALQVLVSAATAKDRTALGKVFGSEYDKLLSGDQVEDDKDLSDFSAAVQESAKLQKDSDSKVTVVVGKDSWPTPIPIVQKDGKWFFDTKTGLDEVLNRRIGENELSAIETCRAYAVAQWEYYTEGDWDHDGVIEYAQHFISSPGKHDGLYWETAEGAKLSPLGKFVAAARADGYRPNDQTPGAAGKGGSEKEAPSLEHAPFHGYYVKILTRQGVHAPGGKYSYIINGNMIAGYALVAYPAKWGNSGVMTFIVNQTGRVYEKNLGANTAKIAAALTEYDPDPTWKRVETAP
jgi:hypothetical protein